MKRNLFKKFLAPLGLVVLSAALWAADTGIVNGQDALDVLGQTDGSGNPIFTDGTPYESQRLEGFNFPYDVALDTSSHRLFVSDYNGSRVVVYNLDSSNTLVDRTADYVLGQPDHSNKRAGNTTAASLNLPVGVGFDSTGNRLFVGDNTNNRVVVYDVASITNGENAVNVLGQANFTTGTGATTINGLDSPRKPYYDESNQRLYVVDYANNRIMIFDLTAITDGENAVNVIGQPDFTTATANTTINGFNAPATVDLDTVNQRLFVADYTNNRVMVFDVNAITNGENAVNVLGQSSFTTSTYATSVNAMYSPFGVAYSTATQRLFVSQASNNRITIFDAATITDGENAVNVLGQPNFTTGSSGTTQSKAYTPRGLALDVANDRLYAIDQYNYRVLVFNISTTTIADGQNAENIVGQTDGAGNGVYTTRNGFDGAALIGMDYPYDVVVDTTAHRLFVADHLSNRVLVHNLDSSNLLTDGTPDNILGQTNYTEIRDWGAKQDSNSWPTGLAYDPARNYLFVSNYYRNRLMVFDVASITDAENAINVLGQANFTANTAAATAAGMSGPYGVKFKTSSQKLYVADRNNHRITIYDVASITNGENAVNVLGQSNFTANTYVNPPTAASLRSPYDLELHEDRLFVIDEYNHRVMVFDVASITDGENAVNVLGQSLFTTRTSATTASGMKYPRGGVIDSETNRLYISDSDNHRVMVYDVTSITDGENAVNVLGQSNFTSALARTSSSGLYNPRGLYYDSTLKRLIVSDTGNSRIIIQSVAPVGQTFDGGTSVVGASAGLSQGGAVWGDFDMDGDLDMAVSGTDGSNNQIQVYANNGNGTFNSTAVNVAAANSGLKDGDVAWGDFDSDGDLDVLANGYDGANRQLKVYKNNGNATFNTTAVDVPGSANVGLSTGAVACGDFDNDGDLDVLAGGYDGGPPPKN